MHRKYQHPHFTLGPSIGHAVKNIFAGSNTKKCNHFSRKKSKLCRLSGLFDVFVSKGYIIRILALKFPVSLLLHLFLITKKRKGKAGVKKQFGQNLSDQKSAIPGFAQNVRFGSGFFVQFSFMFKCYYCYLNFFRP